MKKLNRIQEIGLILSMSLLASFFLVWALLKVDFVDEWFTEFVKMIFGV